MFMLCLTTPPLWHCKGATNAHSIRALSQLSYAPQSLLTCAIPMRRHTPVGMAALQVIEALLSHKSIDINKVRVIPL